MLDGKADGCSQWFLSRLRRRNQLLAGYCHYWSAMSFLALPHPTFFFLECLVTLYQLLNNAYACFITRLSYANWSSLRAAILSCITKPKLNPVYVVCTLLTKLCRSGLLPFRTMSPIFFYCYVRETSKLKFSIFKEIFLLSHTLLILTTSALDNDRFTVDNKNCMSSSISCVCFPDLSVLIFSSKDDLRECGAIQALCRLLSLNRDPLILQHILASLASLSFENERWVLLWKACLRLEKEGMGRVVRAPDLKSGNRGLKILSDT